jgi:hypothetical protein
MRERIPQKPNLNALFAIGNTPKSGLYYFTSLGHNLCPGTIFAPNLWLTALIIPPPILNHDVE